MSEIILQLFVVVFLGFASPGQSHVPIEITNKNQAEDLKAYAEHQIVFPYVVDGEGNFLSHNIHHRSRRSLDPLPAIHYHIPFKNERFHLELKPNNGFMVSGLEVEWRSGKRTRADRNCHFIGSIRNYTKSSVAISNCRGLAGLIRAEQSREFFIEPVLGLDPSEHDGKHAHVIYRRSVEEGLGKNSTEPACGVTVEDVQGRDDFEEEPKEEVDGFYVKRRSKRSVSVMKHIELLLVADHSLTKYYSDRDLESYLFTIMNMMSLVFKHRSVGSAIDVVLVRMIIIDTEHEEGLNITNHARKSLNNFCRWVQTINPQSDLDPRHADAAVLVTRKDICRNSYTPCHTLGLSNMDGMCTSGRECSLNQDTGFTLVYTVAHELGHNLGVLHDDDYSSCSRLRDHIMASNLVIHPSDQLWSRCSRRAMKSFFYKGWGWCLNDQPGNDLEPKLPRRILPGERFDADAQCKVFFGNKSTICNAAEEGLCDTLWCTHSSGYCATKRYYGKAKGFPALDGTPCGKTKHQWCLKGKCARKVRLQEPIDGSWGTWSHWGACSRSCGRGVRRRTRKCNSPRPEHGGYYCVGEWKRHTICNPQSCPKGSDHPVQIQCKKYRALLVNGKRYDWTAIQDHRNPCELRCIPVVQNGRSRIRKFIRAGDGTPCNHGTRNICIQGKCEHVGCDEKLYSSAREDRCGVCRGDGGTCETRHESFDQPDGEGYVEALVIPAQSRNIIIQEASGSPNYLALRSASGDFYLNGNWYIKWSGVYDVAGASGQYSRRHNRDTFKTKGPITEDLHVLLLYQGKNTGLNVQYDVKKNGTTKPRYFRWKYSHWSPCSVTCGQGIQTRDMDCVDQENNIVDVRFCKNKYRSGKRRCNRGKTCPPTWWIGVWHDCSKTCGRALKYRAVLCTHVVLDRIHIIDDETKCPGKKPAVSAVCEQPLCWAVHPWSNCSSLCGLGLQHRVVECPGNASQCDLSTKPITNRTCMGNTCAQWRVGPWEDCSKSCGNGTQIRHVSCEDHNEDMCGRYEKPRSTQACPGVPCPVWRIGDWSECSVTCGKGMKTRHVACEQVHVNFTCDPLQKPAVVQPCLQKQCSGWSVGEWSACSASCGEGIRERKVICTFKSCSAVTRPEHKESCLVRECPQWSASEWSACSVSCGQGTQYRNVTCSDPTNPCPKETMPVSIQKCLVSECSVWSFSNWSECSVNCGSGVQTRSIICNAATQEECERDIPEAERPCNERPCVMWETGNWSECSTTCGPGVQQRSVRCPGDSCNLNEKPNATRPCFNPDCQTVWVTGNWGECDVRCGEGVQTRQVYCSYDDESLCSAFEMPESTRDCFVSRCDAWIVTRWGPCSARCGQGYTTRNATCIYPDSRNCSDRPDIVKLCQEAHCTTWTTGRWSPCSVTCGRGSQRRVVSCHGGQCDASSKPLSTKDCAMPSCGQWVPSNWSECSTSCGDGIQIRDVRCSDVDPRTCTDSKPAVKRYCKKQDCPFWSVGDWQSCSLSCGNGTQRRNVTCINGTCSNSTKPVEFQPCNPGECPAWRVGEWTPCSRSCGSGFQIRIVYCDGESYSSCNRSTKPKSNKRCNKVPCPHWTTGHWSACSKSCNGGIQNRNVSCTNSHVGECAKEREPSTTQKCGELPCPEWTVGLWSKCSKSCNGGIQSRILSCNNSHVGACPESSKPARSQTCGQLPCPEWSVGQWSKCSKSCGGGTQTRDVKCNNSHVGDCVSKDKPASSETCGEVPCPEWSVGVWTECSKSCGGGMMKRTVSCKNNHVGKCNLQMKPASMAGCRDIPCPQWTTGEWSPCSKSCDGGVQSRSVNCNNSDVGECSMKDKPAVNRSCGRLPCPQWKVSPWKKCSKSCGGGLKIRTVICANRQVGDCVVAEKPRVVRRCRKIACPSWMVGEWSGCSKSCGGGVQVRNISCKNNHIGPCDAQDKPLDRQKCSDVPCPRWSVGQWSECSRSCNGGMQTRTVTCENGHIGKCPAMERPTTNQECGVVPCPQWSAGQWSECSQSCGGGTQTRNVSCSNNHVGDCPVTEKPTTNQLCGNVPCPYWTVATWSECSKSCDGGFQIRNVFCKNSHVGDCSVEEKPATNQTCSELPCPKWTVGSWSKCSKSCGGGVKHRTVSCENSHVGKCSVEEKPATNQTCSEMPCPKWTVGSWSECSKSCGGGVKHRTVSCENSHVGKCSVEEKPATNQTCSELPCPKWTVGSWSECSKSCGGGVKHRTVSCENSHVGKCSVEEKPATNQTCSEVPCPKWTVGSWSECSKSCGGGVKHRTVSCKNSHVGKCLQIEKPGNTTSCRDVPCPKWYVGKWSKCSRSCDGGIQSRPVSCENAHIGECLAMDRPNSTRQCGKLPCPKWSVSKWSQCSKSCDGGIQSRIVTCENHHVGACSAKDKPNSNQTCANVPCPVWSVGEWSKCSKTCDGGVQKRIVKCNNSHVGDCLTEDKPSLSQKCNKVPCPRWSVGQWSTCSKSCDGGIKTRTITCTNSHVGACLITDKPEASMECGEVPCPEWSVGAWSECSRSCDGGTQSRTVSCKNSHVGKCVVADRPDSTQACGDEPCPEWSITEWSPCSKSCNNGVQTRNVTCHNGHVGDCVVEHRPDDSRTCNNVPCPMWSAGIWSECSKSCGGGIQTRTVMCKNNYVGDCLVADKPTGSRKCSDAPCPMWSAGIWSECSKSCGGGIQTRTVICKNNYVGDCLAKDKPITNKNCADVPCPKWSVSQWSSCSKSCDGGTQTRTVICKNNYVGDCLVADKPTGSRKCSDVPCPMWSAGIWSECSKSCGGGIQTRTVICKNNYVGDCLAKDKPITNKNCADVPCPKWSVGEWSTCSKSCDGGTQTRTVICKNNYVGDCLAKDKPITNKNCADVPCPKWSVGQWSSCSKSCDGGTQTRTVICKNNYVGDCLAKDKPITNKNCADVPCPEWSVGQWSSCSKSCDGGTQTRTVICKNNYVGDCLAKDKPITNKNCADVPCPEWSVGQWSSCSKSCDGGTQTRTVICENNQVGDCLVADKPTGTRKCSDVPCPKWSVGEWSTCSRSCDGGVKTRTVTCENSHIGSCLLRNKPEKDMKCNEVSCPEWSVGEWSKCSQSCNGGTQTRSVTCRNSHVGECPGKSKPLSKQTCGEIPCPKWTVGNWSECSKSCGSGERSRTVHCTGGSMFPCQNTKPASHETCNDVACPEWIVGNWTSCKSIQGRKCPKGRRFRTVDCSWDDRRVCNQKTRPVRQERCEVECPQWQTAKWSQCYGSCKKGIMLRRVWCEGGDRFCKMREKPSERKSCQMSSCKVWESGEWNVCPVSCGGGLRSRSVHCVSTNTRELTQGCDRATKPEKVTACALNECPPSPDDVRPPSRTKCRQAIQDRYFCDLLLKPSLRELCLYKRWRQRCCKSCFRINAQRKKK